MASKRKRTHTCKKRARTLRKVHRRRRSGGMLMLQALKSAFTKKELKKLMLVNAIYLKSMWIRTGNHKRIYDAYNDAVVKTSAGRDSNISKDVTTETLTEYRTRLDGLYNAITDPTQKMLVDEDMFNVQQLLQSNPDNANESLRQFLHDIGNEDAVQTSASAAHPPPPHDSLSSQWDQPPPLVASAPPLVASAPPMDPQYPSPSYPPPYTPPYPPPSSYAQPPPHAPPPSWKYAPPPPHAPPPSYAPPPPYPPPPHAPPPSYPPPPYLPPLGPSAPPMDPPPPPSYAPHMHDPQYGYFDIHGNRSIIPGNGRLRRI